MELRNVVFDLDGTLVDSLPGIEYCVDRALEATGRAPRTGSLRTMIGPPIREILSDVAREDNTRLLDEMEQAFRASYDSEGWQKTTLNPGARETLDWLLETERRAFLITNKPAQATHQILEQFNLSAFFSRILCREGGADPLVRAGRPRPAQATTKTDMLRSLIHTNEVSPADSMVVGDTREDLQAAQQTGMPAAILRNGYGDFQPSPHPSYYLLNDLSELRQILDLPGGTT